MRVVLTARAGLEKSECAASGSHCWGRCVRVWFQEYVDMFDTRSSKEKDRGKDGGKHTKILNSA